MNRSDVLNYCESLHPDYTWRVVWGFDRDVMGIHALHEGKWVFDKITGVDLTATDEPDALIRDTVQKIIMTMEELREPRT